MPVTIKPTENRARKASINRISTGWQLLEGSCRDEYGKCERIIQSSFNHVNLRNASSSKNGFIYACINAYNQHHHLIIRPDDVWCAILSQLGLYVNGNAEELRSVFVSHKGQEALVVESTWERFPEDIMRAMEKHMNEPDLPEWIKPDFSTTTPEDVTVACILMMGAMQQFFTYCMIGCGLPSVTLLGERNDWQRMFEKIDRLVGMSEQAATFHSLLKPVLGYFVRSFDEPEAPEIMSFWNRIVHYQSQGSGPTYVSGWLTAFCFWSAQGRSLYHKGNVQYSAKCNLDGTLYHTVDAKDIPAGYMGVPVKDLQRPHKKYRMVAGSVGIRCTSSGRPMESIPQRMPVRRTGGSNTVEVAGLDSMQPVSGWWIYELNDKAAGEIEKTEKKTKVKNSTTLEVGEKTKVKKSTTLKGGVKKLANMKNRTVRRRREPVA